MKATTPLLPPAVFLIAIVVMAGLHALAPDAPVSGARRVLGLLLLSAGAMMNLIAARQFERTATPIRPFEPVRTLVTSGLYRYSRNPMYLGGIVMLTGLALFLGSVSAMLVPPVFAAFVDLRFVRREEAMLSHSLGEEYARYARRVRRWL